MSPAWRERAPERDYHGFEVDLEAFAGPLDLLLSLIRGEQIDIFDIPLARITDQYLAALDRMAQAKVEVTGEFLVMAATLMQIKSRMLLPRPPKAEGAEDEEDDPRQELIDLLLEYQRYQEAASWLDGLSAMRQRMFEAVGDPVEAGPAPLEEAGLTALFRAYERLLTDTPEPDPPKLREMVYSVAEQADYLLARLALGPCEFGELFEGRPTRLEVVVTFMALLDLVRNRRVRAEQDGLFGAIQLHRVDPTPAG